jgi:L,D-peptidoglycan transpeptidase YkuD (ErfK/YbiS/YcfS/YnhG family)
LPPINGRLYVSDLIDETDFRNWRFPVPKPSLTQNWRNRIKKYAAAQVHMLSSRATLGTLRFRNLTFPAAIGKNGVYATKREGDGASPRGAWPVMRIYYRPDRLRRPRTALPAKPMHPGLGWCDAPGDRNYNRPVRLPYPASTETLWREDGLYDVIAVLDYNISRRGMGRGSAIFVHVASPGFKPTAGCIALKREHLLRLLAVLPRGAVFAAGKDLRGFSAAGAGSGTGRSPALRGRASKRRR